MNKMKKLLSVVLAVVLAFSAFSVLGSAARTAYKTVDDLTALDAYSPYGQVTRLSLEERTSIVFDALDNLLPTLNINMGEVFNVLGLSVTIDLTSVDRLCYSFDTIKSTFNNTLASIAMAIVDLGILESLNVDTWATGMTRDGTAQFTILSEILEFLSANTTLINNLFTQGLDLGIVSLGDMSSIEDIIMNLPGFVKGLVYPMIERWDDNLAVIKELDASIAGTSADYNSVEAVANWRVKKLFSDNMSITTVKYNVSGTMTSEHTGMPFRTTAPGAPEASSPRCVYVINGTTPGSTLTVYHIVDAEEAKALAEDSDPDNDAAAYSYVAEEQIYMMAQEVDGSETYVWKAVDEKTGKPYTEGGWSMKWYNDDSNWLDGISGDDIDLRDMSLADLLYTFIPPVFANMAPVVLNGSVKKILAEFLGAKFIYVGQGGPEADDAVLALGNNEFFTREQEDYLWEWSDYAVIDGTHYYRFENQIFVGDLSQKNNYFDIINWDYEIGADFMNEFVPENGGSTSDTLLMNLNDFIIKVANTALKDSAATVDAISGFEKQWTKPALTAGGNDKLVANLKALAQAVIGLAPQHVFGSDYATNERCYVELMLSDDDDTVLTGIAAHIVNMVMPSMSLPGKSDLLASNAKVGAILAAVIREFAAYLAPEYNFDALIYTDFGTTTADPVKSFIAGKDSGYWLDVCLTMGINVGFEYLRAFADMGEGTPEWNSFVAYSGYGVDGKTYAAGTTQEALNAEWEGMLDYIIDWALEKDYEWCWAMENLVDVDGEINLATAQDPWKKLDSVLNALLPVDEILNVKATDCETELEQLLRYDLILAIVDLRWNDLANILIVPDGFVRNTNVLDQLATKLKGIVNYLFKKVGNTNHNFALIPAAITDFDSLANQTNLVTLVKNLVGALYTAGVTNGGCRTLFPFLNFLLGWKTDPQVIADPVMWTDFRDGNDYAFQYNVGNGGAIDSATTKIKILNNSAGMLETHRGSDVTDHAYDINIRNVTSDAELNTVTFEYDNVVSPYETVDIKIGGTYRGNESVTVTIEYDYVGKDGQPVGGTQYTSITFLLSNLYEDSNLSSCQGSDHDDDYTGLTDVKGYVFTEDLFTTVTEYTAEIHYVAASFSNPDKSFVGAQAEGSEMDCNGNPSKTGDVPTAPASNYFTQITATKANPGEWAKTLSKEGTSSTRAHLFAAKSGVTADTEFAYGAYDLGGMGIKYGSDTKVVYVDFIYYNDYNIYDIYTANKDNGYNANQGVDAATYEEYRVAWNKIVELATFPMMTTARNPANWEGVTAAGTSANDYVSAIMPQIEPAIAAYEEAKEAYETALAEAQSSGAADSDLPSYVVALQEAIDDDFINDKEINFQDYNFYEYFNYNDEKVKGEELYRTFLAPEVMDRYYILNSGIREAELDNVIDAETNPFVAAGITASRMENDANAIAESQRLHDEWKMPITSKLVVEDMTARINYYKQFLEANAEPDVNGEPAHMYFLKQEIAHINAQGLAEADYTAASWAEFAERLEIAEAVAAGTDEFGYSNYNSDIYSVKYNLMVAYKNLLEKERSLIEAGGTGTLNANIETAEAIFASLEAGDGVWALAADYEGEANAAYAQLISALGYYYVGEDGNTWNLYADSAYEYRDNDRPNNQNNQAKVNASNAALEAAIANFETAVGGDPELILTEYGVEMGAIIHLDICVTSGDYVGAIYGVDTLNGEALEDYYTTEFGSVEFAENGNDVMSTGATASLLDDDGVVIATYVFIYFGDVNGDGVIDITDATAIESHDAWEEMLEEDTAFFYSADVNYDTVIDITDATAIESHDAWEEMLPSQAELGAGFNEAY